MDKFVPEPPLRRIGIVGGAFNPPHRGHLAIATEMTRFCKLDRVVFIPTATPPHKDSTALAPFCQRCAMVELAVADNPQFSVSAMEGQRSGPSYTVHTIQQLRHQLPGAELFFLMGMDSLLALPTWRDYTRLFSMCHLVVARRPGHKDIIDVDALPVAIRKHFCYDSTLKTLSSNSGHQLIFLPHTYMNISATAIREMIAAGEEIDHLVPEAIAEYIKSRNLYTGRER